MVLISDVYISATLEIIFLFFFFKSFKYNYKSIYIIILNVAFFLVNLLVFLTIIIADLDLTIANKGWYLGFFTELSYLILPLAFYWFTANFKNFTEEPKKLKYSTIQLVFLILVILGDILPLFVPDLIYVARSDIYSYYNWDYTLPLFLTQFMLWLGLLVAWVIVLDVTNRAIEKNEVHKKLHKMMTYSAFVVFSTPVFFVINQSFIILSLLVYIASYIIVYEGLTKYYRETA